jgi:hypothetical protein
MIHHCYFTHRVDSEFHSEKTDIRMSTAARQAFPQMRRKLHSPQRDASFRDIRSCGGVNVTIDTVSVGGGRWSV